MTCDGEQPSIQWSTQRKGNLSCQNARSINEHCKILIVNFITRLGDYVISINQAKNYAQEYFIEK